MRKNLQRAIVLLVTVLMILPSFPASADVSAAAFGDKCPVCGDSDYWDRADFKEPTCTEKGFISGYCVICGRAGRTGDDYMVKKTVPALGHDWGKWTVLKESTCAVRGEQKHTCKRCGKTKTEEMELKPHTWGEWTVVREAEDFSMGLREHTCTMCNALKQEEFYPDGTLKSGDKGEAVTALQEALNAAGYDCGKADGSYGKKTVAAVTKLEEANGLTGDGIAWPGVRALLGPQGPKTRSPQPVPSDGGMQVELMSFPLTDPEGNKVDLTKDGAKPGDIVFFYITLKHDLKKDEDGSVIPITDLQLTHPCFDGVEGKLIVTGWWGPDYSVMSKKAFAWAEDEFCFEYAITEEDIEKGEIVSRATVTWTDEDGVQRSVKSNEDTVVLTAEALAEARTDQVLFTVSAGNEPQNGEFYQPGEPVQICFRIRADLDYDLSWLEDPYIDDMVLTASVNGEKDQAQWEFDRFLARKAEQNVVFSYVVTEEDAQKGAISVDGTLKWTCNYYPELGLVSKETGEFSLPAGIGEGYEYPGEPFTLPEDAKLYNRPVAQPGNVIRKLAKGTTVLILEEQDDWLKVCTADQSKVGYILFTDAIADAMASGTEDHCNLTAHALNKDMEPQSVFAEGDVIHWAITIGNDAVGPENEPWMSEVSIQDPRTGSETAAEDVPYGGSVTVVIKDQVTKDDVAKGTINDWMTVEWTDPKGAKHELPCFRAVLVLASADVVWEKDESTWFTVTPCDEEDQPKSTFTAGEQINMNFTYGNSLAGPEDTACMTEVTITDDLTALVYPRKDVSYGGGGTGTVFFKATEEDAEAGSIDYTAYLSWTDPEGVKHYRKASAHVDVLPFGVGGPGSPAVGGSGYTFILEKDTILYKSPSKKLPITTDAQMLLRYADRLPAGTAVTIRKELGDWLYVVSDSGKRGYIAVTDGIRALLKDWYGGVVWNSLATELDPFDASGEPQYTFCPGDKVRWRFRVESIAEGSGDEFAAFDVTVKDTETGKTIVLGDIPYGGSETAWFDDFVTEADAACRVTGIDLSGTWTDGDGVIHNLQIRKDARAMVLPPDSIHEENGTYTFSAFFADADGNQKDVFREGEQVRVAYRVANTKSGSGICMEWTELLDSRTNNVRNLRDIPCGGSKEGTYLSRETTVAELESGRIEDTLCVSWYDEADQRHFMDLILGADVLPAGSDTGTGKEDSGKGSRGRSGLPGRLMTFRAPILRPELPKVILPGRFRLEMEDDITAWLKEHELKRPLPDDRRPAEEQSDYEINVQPFGEDHTPKTVFTDGETVCLRYTIRSLYEGGKEGSCMTDLRVTSGETGLSAYLKDLPYGGTLTGWVNEKVIASETADGYLRLALTFRWRGTDGYLYKDDGACDIIVTASGEDIAEENGDYIFRVTTLDEDGHEKSSFTEGERVCYALTYGNELTGDGTCMTDVWVLDDLFGTVLPGRDVPFGGSRIMWLSNDVRAEDAERGSMDWNGTLRFVGADGMEYYLKAAVTVTVTSEGSGTEPEGAASGYTFTISAADAQGLPKDTFAAGEEIRWVMTIKNDMTGPEGTPCMTGLRIADLRSGQKTEPEDVPCGGSVTVVIPDTLTEADAKRTSVSNAALLTWYDPEGEQHSIYAACRADIVP